MQFPMATVKKNALYTQLHLSEMEILAQPLCETVFTPTTFRHTKVADQNFKTLP
jgi:hypothetical protein